MLTIREVMLAKIESTYNVDPSPLASADAIRVSDPSWSNEGARMIERSSVRPSLGTEQQVFGGSLRTVSFDVEIKGAGAAYSSSVRPELDVLLRACAVSSTVVTTSGSESVTYASISTGHESLTLYYYEDGKLRILTGCKGTASPNLENGEKGMMNFTFTGHTATPTDASLVTPTYDSTLPPPVIGAAFSIDSYSAIINSLQFDLNNEVITPSDISSSDGYGTIQIVKRDIAGSFDPESVLVASEAFEANWRSGKLMALSTGDIGSTQYNKYNLTMPGVYYREIGQGARDGLRTYDITFGAVETTTDNEWSLTFD